MIADVGLRHPDETRKLKPWRRSGRNLAVSRPGIRIPTLPRAARRSGCEESPGRAGRRLPLTEAVGPSRRAGCVVCSCRWGYCFRAMRVRRGLGARLWGLAPVVLMPAAAFAVHQLRYYLAYGSAAGAELQRTGHSYLHSVVPWIVGLVALAVGGFLWSLGRAMAGQRSLPRFTVSFLGLWAACAVSLVAIFATQEFLGGSVRDRASGWDWRGFLALVAGGRFPPQLVLVLCWRRCFTAPGGCSMRSRSAMRVRGGRRWFASRRCPDLRRFWLRGWRRWPRVGRAAVLPGS